MISTTLLLLILEPVLCSSFMANELVDRKTMNARLHNGKFKSIYSRVAKTLRVNQKGDANTTAECVSKIFQWAAKGFPDDLQKHCFRFVRTWYACVLEWLLPMHRRGTRSHDLGWKLACALSSIIGLHDLWHWNRKVKPFRVMLRSFGQEVQRSLLEQQHTHPHWRKYVSVLFGSIFYPKQIDSESICYYAWAQHQKRWYVGKANTLRHYHNGKGGNFKVAGVPARFKEHVLGTRAGNTTGRLETRYLAWQNTQPHEFCFLPFVWGDMDDILKFELKIISVNQAPMHNRVKPGGNRPARHRDYKRFRSIQATQEELLLNFCCSFKHEPQHAVDGHLFSFKLLCIWAYTHYNFSVQQVIENAYTIQHVDWLGVLLSCSGSRLEYQRVWNSKHARALMLGAWCATLKFSRVRAQRAQLKIERFLNTSPLLNPRIFNIHVPGKNPRLVAAVHRHIAKICAIVHRASPWMSTFIRHRVRIMCSKPPKLRDLFRSHISVAKSFTPKQIMQVSKHDRKMYEHREDVHTCNVNWDIPWEPTAAFSRVQIETQLKSLCGRLQIGPSYIFGAFDFEPDLESRERAENLLSGHLKFVSDCWWDNSCLAVTLDKDPKRVCFMSKQGFLYRLAKGYICDTNFYEMMSGRNGDELAKYKGLVAKQHLPKSISKKAFFQASNVAYGYHNYKAKCLGPDGLICKKDHAHEREIISDVASPIKGSLRNIAKAVRQTKLLSKEHAWTLWNQSQFTHELLRRYHRLKQTNELTETCICGAAKNSLCMLKVDAAQFFKAASIDRGIARVHALLRRVSSKHKCNAIAIPNNKHADGYFCQTATRKSNSHKVISFACIKKHFKFLRDDEYF